MIIFRKATVEDFSFLFRLRNDPATRQYSKNAAPVTEPEHRAWLSVSLANPKRFLYIAVKEGAPVGTVRFDRRKDGFAISWTVTPEVRGKGIGTEMLTSALSLHESPIIAEIKGENIASQKIAEHTGFIRREDRKGYTVWEYRG